MKTLIRVAVVVPAMALLSSCVSDYSFSLTPKTFKDSALLNPPEPTPTGAPVGISGPTGTITPGGPVTTPTSTPIMPPVTSGGPTPMSSPSPKPSNLTTATADSYVQTATDLYTFNLSDGKPAHLFSFSMKNGSTPPEVSDIAIDSTGVMYAVSHTALYYVDLKDGSLSEAWSFSTGDLGNVNALTALADGRLIIGGKGIAILDLKAGVMAKIQLKDANLNSISDPQSSGDIQMLPDGNLYWTVTGGFFSGGDDLLKIDPRTGITTTVGNLGIFDVYGLGYAGGVLYGFAASGDFFQIDPATARTSNVTAGSQEWFGATTNPVKF